MRLVWITVIFLAVIGIAAVVHRALALYSPARVSDSNNPATAMDAGFVRHPRLTFAHILPGALFMVLGPLQFSPAIRPRYLRFHRWSGHVFVLNGLVIGVSTLVMSYTMAIGGANETAATTFLGTIPKR